MSYPEFVIVQATSHGGIELDDEGNPVEFQLPPGMTVTKLSAVTPGVCNVLTPEVSNYFTRVLLSNKAIILELLEFMQDKSLEYITELGAPKIIEGLIQSFKGQDANTVERVESGMKASGEIDTDLLDYIHSFDQSYSYTPKRMRMVNKLYSRSSEEYFSEGIEGTWDYKINILNVSGHPDLIREIAGRTHRQFSEISTKDIMGFLYERGVRGVFFVDFSCSNYIEPLGHEPISSTAQRAKTRDLRMRGYHGGKRKSRKLNLKGKRKGKRKRKTTKRRKQK